MVETDAPDRNLPSPARRVLPAIAGHLLEFFAHEVASGRLPARCSRSSRASATSPMRRSTEWRSPVREHDRVHRGHPGRHARPAQVGEAPVASATAFSLSPEAAAEFNRQRGLPGQDHAPPAGDQQSPETVRRLGVLAMNGVIEADIYGTSTPPISWAAGSRTASVARATSPAMPTYRSSSRLRPPRAVRSRARASGLARRHTYQTSTSSSPSRGWPTARAGATSKSPLLIDNCAHPDYRPALEDYFRRAQQGSYGLQSPSLLGEALLMAPALHRNRLDAGLISDPKSTLKSTVPGQLSLSTPSAFSPRAAARGRELD